MSTNDQWAMQGDAPAGEFHSWVILPERPLEVAAGAAILVSVGACCVRAMKVERRRSGGVGSATAQLGESVHTPSRRIGCAALPYPADYPAETVCVSRF